MMNLPILPAVGMRTSTEAIPTVGQQDEVQQNAALRESAQNFETVFISQVLKYTGFSKALSQGMGSAANAFASIQLNKVAEEISAAGGFGLQQNIYEALKTKSEGS